MTHPAGDHLGVGKRAVWYGVEVEGPLCLNKPTVFIDSWPNIDDVRDIKGRIEWREVVHIFLTENFDDFEKFAAEFIPELWHHQRVEVTIGTFPDRLDRLLALPWISLAHLMVRASMDADWVSKLRTHDQVSVGKPYDLMTWAVSDGIRTIPNDYKEDKT